MTFKKITAVLILLIFCICSFGTGCIEATEKSDSSNLSDDLSDDLSNGKTIITKGQSGSSNYFLEESVTLTKEDLINLGNDKVEFIAEDEYGNKFYYESRRTGYN